MASEIRVNKIRNRSGLGTVTFADTGVDLAGIVTATTFSGSGASLTNIPSAQLTGALPAISGANLTGIAATDNVRTGILDVAGVGTFRNDVNIPDKIIHLGDTDTAIRFPSADTVTVETGGSERLRITGDGPHLLLGGTADVNEITESSSNTGMVIGDTSLGNGGLAIINSTTGTGRVYFGDATGSDAGRNRGQINYYHSSDYMMFATAGSERVRISSGGDITNTGPDTSFVTTSYSGNFAKLDIRGTNIANTNHYILSYGEGHANDHEFHMVNTLGDLVFRTSAERFRIRSGGDVTTTGDTGFTRTTAGITARSGDSFSVCRSAGTPLEVCRTSNTGAFVNWFSGSTAVASISYNGSTFTYGGTSDYRLKENVIEMTGGIDAVKKLKPIKFNFITTPEKTVEGFIAHEVQEVIPQAVVGEKDAEIDEEGLGYQQLDPAQLVPTLTAALQEAVAKIETLETKVAALEGS